MNNDILTINNTALVDAINNGLSKEQILKSIADQVNKVLEDNSKKTKLAEARKAAKTALVAYVCELADINPDHIDDATFNSIDSIFDQFEAAFAPREKKVKEQSGSPLQDFLVKYNLI